MNDNVTIEGEIDGSYTSYWDPKEHGHMSETVDGTTEDDLHSESTTAIPEEVDEDNLTDRQLECLEAYFVHPKASQNELSEITGAAKETIKKALDNAGIDPNWPERLEAKGMDQYAKSARFKMDNAQSDDTEEDTPTGEDIVENIKDNVEAAQTAADSDERECGMDALQTALDAIEATAQTEETKQAIDHIRGLL